MQEISFTLRPLPPFSLELTVWALRRRPNNEVDRWDGMNYSRIFVFEDNAAKVSVSQEGGHDKPKLHVAVAVETSDPKIFKSRISATLEKMFSLKKDLGEFYSLSRGDKRLRPLVEQFIGVKPPRFPTLFEALVNAFSCQQISLDLGIILLNHLSHSHGVAFRENNAVFHAFPRPKDLAVLSTEDLRKLGLSRNKGLAIVELSKGIINENVEIEGIEKMSDTEIDAYLSRIRGVGRWSSEYVLLRGMGRIHKFPGDDVSAQRTLQNFMGLHERPDYDEIKRITSRWQPYAGVVYFHFLLDRLKTKGFLP
jgi:DNA-3-methyladenine glycosylase II